MDSLLDTDMVLLDIEAATREEIIERMATILTIKDRVNDKQEYIKKVFEREALFSTAIGLGVAIPHGKSTAVVQASVAVGRLKQEIPWGDSGELVKIIFLLAIPEAEAGDKHLRILAQLSGRLMDDEFRDKLIKLEQQKDIVSLLDFDEPVMQ